MRFLSLGIFLFCIHISMALANSSGVFLTTIDPAQSWFDDVGQEEIEAAAYNQGNVDAGSGIDISDIAKGLFYFVLTLGASIVVIPWTFVQFGLPVFISVMLSLPFYAMYFIGIAQLIANRASKGMR